MSHNAQWLRLASMVQRYTTDELAQILAQEREACLRGDRLNLTTTSTCFNPVVDPFLNVEGLQKFRAFCDFQSAVHAYQRQYQISGLVWRSLTVAEQSIDYPEVDDHLIALPEDLSTLAAHKDRVFNFWQQVTQGMDYYQQWGKHLPHERIEQVQANTQAQRSEWACLHQLQYAQTQEITVQLGWGDPKEALYQKYWPLSGCCFIHGVAPGHRPQSGYY